MSSPMVDSTRSTSPLLFLSPGGFNQGYRSISRCAHKRRIVAHQACGNPAGQQQGELRGNAIGIGNAQPRQQIAEPQSAPFLEGDGKLVGFPNLLAKLGDSIDKGAAAKALVRDRTLKAVEGAQNLLKRRSVGHLELDQTTGEVCRDQRVL